MAKTIKDLASPIRLTFEDKIVNTNGKTTAVVTTALLAIDNIPVRLIKGIGTAKVNESAGDTFDLSTGKRIASARSENKCYIEAKHALTEFETDLANKLSQVRAKKQLIDSYLDHNREYIKRLC